MKGRGLKLYAKAPADSTYIRVNKIKSYTPGEESVATSERTFLDQDEGSYTDHSTGLVDAGEVSFSVEWDKADAGQILVHDNLGKRLDFKLEWNNGDGETYTGTVTKRGTGDPNDDHLVRSYTVKRAGAAPAAFVAST